jgi:hypothetical protein
MSPVRSISFSVMAGLVSAGFGHPPRSGEHPQIDANQPVAEAVGDSSPHKTAELRDGFRLITSNGLPDHETGRFPGPGNPGRITEQQLEFRVPVQPTWSATPIEVGPFGRPGALDGTGRPPPRPIIFGIALNGVIFDPGTAEWWNDDPASGWHVEALGPDPRLGLDHNHAHVQPPTGQYHYHAIPTLLLERLAGEHPGSRMVQLGWAADGFPIYARWGHAEALDGASPVRALRPSYRLRTGSRPVQENGPGGVYDGSFVEDYEFAPGSGDLDAYNGRYGVTPEFPNGTYYYVLTDQFPFVPRRFRGVPDQSFRKGPRVGRPR